MYTLFPVAFSAAFYEPFEVLPNKTQNHLGNSGARKEDVGRRRGPGRDSAGRPTMGTARQQVESDFRKAEVHPNRSFTIDRQIGR